MFKFSKIREILGSFFTQTPQEPIYWVKLSGEDHEQAKNFFSHLPQLNNPNLQYAFYIASTLETSASINTPDMAYKPIANDKALENRIRKAFDERLSSYFAAGNDWRNRRLLDPHKILRNHVVIPVNDIDMGNVGLYGVTVEFKDSARNLPFGHKREDLPHEMLDRRVDILVAPKHNMHLGHPDIPFRR